MTRAGWGTSDTGLGGAQGADLTGRARATIEDLLKIFSKKYLDNITKSI